MANSFYFLDLSCFLWRLLIPNLGNDMKNLIRKSVEAMSGYVPGEQPKGEGIIKLNTNECLIKLFGCK